MNIQLGEGNIHKLLWQLSIPAILGMLSGAIFNVADRIFVGQIDSLALTAVGITMPIQVLQMALVLLIGVGSSSLISMKLGEEKKEEAEQLLYLALKYIVLAMVFFAIFFMLFSESILRLMSVSEQAMPMAKVYIEIIIVGSIIGIPGYCLNNSLRAIGKARASMKIILISSLLNIILDPIFIFVLDLGIAGAAIATVISQTVLTVYVIGYFFKGKDLPIRLKLGKVQSEGLLLVQIIKCGAPSFYVQVLATFVGVFINWNLLRYGTDLDIATVTIMSTIFSFYHMILFGIVQGNQPICGFNWGAKKYDRVAISLTLSLAYAFGLSLILYMVILLFPSILINLFTQEQILRTATKEAIKIYLCMLPFVGLQTISSQYFQSVGKARLSSGLSLLRYGIIIVPVVFILTPYFGVQGIYMSYAISDLLASLVAIVFIILELKKLRALQH